LNKTREECCIEIYLLHGNLLKKFDVANAISNELSGLIHYPLSVYNSNIYICDSSMVKVFSANNGQLVSTINPYRDESHHKFFRPVSVTFTKCNRGSTTREQTTVIIVATKDSLIYFFDTNGKYLTHIGSLSTIRQHTLTATTCIKVKEQLLMIAGMGDIITCIDLN
jgi:hypothetical protein